MLCRQTVLELLPCPKLGLSLEDTVLSVLLVRVYDVDGVRPCHFNIHLFQIQV